METEHCESARKVHGGRIDSMGGCLASITSLLLTAARDETCDKSNFLAVRVFMIFDFL